MPDLSWAKHRKLLRAPEIGFNAEVYRHFKTNDDAGRNSLRDSLLIGTKDSRSTALFKIQYFRDQVQKNHLKPVVVGEIKSSFDEKVVYKCQVQLYFKQDSDAVPTGGIPIDAVVSFRLDETHETITKAKYTTLARAIATEFASGEGYRWNKGKQLCLYTDLAKGYNFQVYAYSDTEGEEVIKKVLSLQNHSFESDLFRVTNPKKSSDSTPGSVTILGESRKKPRWRPTGYVRFQYADLLVWNVDPIPLVDISGTRPGIPIA